MTSVPSHTKQFLILADRYQLLERLNPSRLEASRETWLAIDLLWNRKPVVVKLAPFRSELNWADFKLFEREATILQVLDYPRIPKHLDFLELDMDEYQGSVLVQEYIEARSFQTQVEAGMSFTTEMVKDIAIQLLEILNYLHQLNPPVIHRDIKPSNLLLSDRSGHSIGKVYLVDFGAVQTIASTEYDTFTVVGTYGYMPFEQFGGQCVCASDLYSLGATLIYLLTGQHPADLPQVNGQIEFRTVVNLDWEFCQWLQKTIAPAVSQRFSTAQEALDKLRAIDLSVNTSNLSKNTEYEDISLERTADRFILKVIGYKFDETLSSLGTIIVCSYLMVIVVLNVLFSGIYTVWFFGCPVLMVILTAARYFQSKRNFVGTLTIDREGIRFKFNVFNFLRLGLIDIIDTNKIIKIEQVLDKTSAKTLLILWNGVTPHSIMLTELNAIWVGERLSEWLKIPFEQRKVIRIEPKK